MPLTDLQIRSAKPEAKPRRLFDGGGLYLEVTPAGGKLWRLKYRFDGKEKRLAFGQYPTIGLADARIRREEAKRLLANGVDPGTVKQAQKAARHEAAANSFQAIAEEWQAKGQKKWSASHTAKTRALLERDAYPWLGKLPITEIKPGAVLSAMRRVEARGAAFTAGRLRQVIGQIIRYAMATNRAEHDPTPSLKGALEPPATKHMASVTDPARVGELLRAFDAFKGTHVVASALRLAPLLFTRIGELRKMKWADLDMERAMWSIPAEVMKMREPHLVPLCRQAVAIINDLRPLTGNGEYVFTNGRDPKRPMSDAAINAALRRLGIDTQNELTGHGFRAMARTILHERLNYAPEMIEAQLAHQTPGPLGAAYARAKFIEQRTKMMQEWADYLDALKAGGKVIVGDFGKPQ